MSKKVIFSLIAVIVIIAAGVGAYFYFKPVSSELDQVQNQPVLNGQIFICTDECGNGVCQSTEAECADGLNCVCNETPQECPSDCK